MSTTLRKTLNGLFDDAGLFPPARRPMAEALTLHQKVAAGPDSRLLGPFLCPAGRMEELDACVASGIPRPEQIGVLLYPGDAHARRACSAPGVVQVEAPLGVPMPDQAMRLRRFYELPPSGDVRAAVATIASSQAFVKVRCGGATPDMVPTTLRLAEVLAACAAKDVVLKATAGLHQPFRHADPGTGGMQHGFLNLLAAASAAVDGAPRKELVAILETEQGADDDGLVARVDRRGRELVASVGTCSLDEPIAALQDLGVME